MTNQNPVFAAFNAQCARIIANATDANSLESKMKDCKKIMRFATEANCLAIADILSPEVVSSIKPQKGVMRFAQAVAFCCNAKDSSVFDVKSYEPSTALIVAAISLSKQKVINFGDMRYIMGGMGDNDTQAVQGVSRSKLQRWLERVGSNTAPTRVSSACGINGFFANLGITQKTGEHEFSIIDKEVGFLKLYALRLESMGDNTFEFLTAK